jgi:hypothetical protein
VAIGAGLQQNTIDPSDAAAYCPTNKCSWDNFTTVGVCAQTEEITHLIEERIISDGNSSRREPIIQFPFAEPGMIWGPSDSKFQAYTQQIGYYNDPIMSSGSPDSQDYVGTRKNDDSDLPDIAQVYLMFYDPCLGAKDPSNNTRQMNVKYWRAFKGRIRLCLQDIEAKFENDLKTTILNSRSNVTWDPEYQYASQQRESTASQNPPFATIEMMGRILSTTFHFAGTYHNDADNNTSWWQWEGTSNAAAQMTVDVLGYNVSDSCQNRTGLGFEGFAGRLNSVATSITNV